MNLLLLTPRSAEVRLSLYRVDDRGEAAPLQLAAAFCEGGIEAARTSLRNFDRMHGVPDAVAIYAPFAGTRLPTASPIDASVARELRGVASRAPLHVPAVLSAIDAVATECPGVPAILVSGSACFADLPACERAYAVDADLCDRLGLERTGRHGLFHAAAARLVESVLVARGPAHVLSICLEPQPEAVAMLGARPLTVSGGATPLEGLPGSTTCGELDPGVVLMLAREHKLGPEEIAHCLARESGLKGLAGRTTNFAEVLESRSPDLRLARDLVLHRLLHAAGSALAVLDGLDAIVFSGRHASVADTVGMWLLERLHKLPGKPDPYILSMREGLEELAVEAASDALRTGQSAAC